MQFKNNILLIDSETVIVTLKYKLLDQFEYKYSFLISSKSTILSFIIFYSLCLCSFIGVYVFMCVSVGWWFCLFLLLSAA